ncbi:MAG: class II glutamine amidotransferase [Candidatus Neomarinimicrobiota bacterium]|nr:class II glutamine amidotransferase [Candidatus Neomarinimicrobiota bacterium]
MDRLLYMPKNSLINQSFHAREREEPLNGDGFGVGWYVPEIEETPAVFSSIQPAWNNRNLRNLSPKIRSGAILAHIRAATNGRVSEANCHPFSYGKLLFMHNGAISGFNVIKRALRMRLSDSIYDWIEGDTDSEHFFALILQHLDAHTSLTVEQLSDAFFRALRELTELLDEHGIDQPFTMNGLLTDGERIVASRYISDESAEARTLYHSARGAFDCVDGQCRIVPGKPDEDCVLVVSEKLTDTEEDWHQVPANHLVIVEHDLSIKIHTITL